MFLVLSLAATRLAAWKTVLVGTYHLETTLEAKEQRHGGAGEEVLGREGICGDVVVAMGVALVNTHITITSMHLDRNRI